MVRLLVVCGCAATAALNIVAQPIGITAPGIVTEPFSITVPGSGSSGLSDPGQEMLAYRRNCTSNCPLLIMLHGAHGDGRAMASRSQLHNIFSGIVAYPTGTCFAAPDAPDRFGWPNSYEWYGGMRSCFMRIIYHLLELPGVDRSRIYLLGFSNGAWFTNSLTCAIGHLLRGAIALSGILMVPAAGCHRTNMLYIHNANDPVNVPTDRGGESMRLLGSPEGLREHWLTRASNPPGKTSTTTDGGTEVTSGPFTHFSAAAANLTWDYWLFDGPVRHAYNVYDGAPLGAPRGMTMEMLIGTYLEELGARRSI